MTAHGRPSTRSTRRPASRVGRWEGGALAARTTHVKAGFIRKTGVPLTDQATIDWRFFRHGDVVTVLMVATDPVYLVGAGNRLEELPVVANAARLPLGVRDGLRRAGARRQRSPLRARIRIRSPTSS